MGITLKWYDDARTIFLFIIRDPWSWEENQRVTEESYRRIETEAGSEIVDYIVVLHDASLTAGRLFSNLDYLAYEKHPREGIKYMVGASGFMRMLGATYQQIRGAASDYIFVDTLEDAHDLIQRNRGDG